MPLSIGKYIYENRITKICLRCIKDEGLSFRRINYETGQPLGRREEKTIELHILYASCDRHGEERLIGESLLSRLKNGILVPELDCCFIKILDGYLYIVGPDLTNNIPYIEKFKYRDLSVFIYRIKEKEKVYSFLFLSAEDVETLQHYLSDKFIKEEVSSSCIEYKRNDETASKIENIEMNQPPIKNNDKAKRKQVTKKEDTMIETRTAGTIAKEVGIANIDAAKQAAKLTAAKAALKIIRNKLTPKLPMVIRGYADTAAFDLVIANMLKTYVQVYKPTDQKWLAISEAILEAAMMNIAEAYNVEEAIVDLFDGIDLSMLTGDVPSEKKIKK